MQFINTCIFCGSKSPSKEHIFPQWLKKIITETERTEFNRNLITIDSPTSCRIQKFEKSANNPTLSSQTKRVCTNCNNQWLSKLENSIIPIFKKLTTEQATELDTQEQTLLSMWASLLSMKWDLTDNNTSGHKSQDIQFIYKNQLAPNNFRVWLGYSEDFGVQVSHKTMIMAKRNEIAPTSPNLRSTGLQLGTVALYILSHEEDVYSEVQEANHLNRRLIQIWPSSSTVVLDRSQNKANSISDMKITTLFFGMQDNVKFISRMLSAFPELLETSDLE